MSGMMGLRAGDRRALIVGVATIGAIVALGRGVPTVLRWESEQRQSAHQVAVHLASVRAQLAAVAPTRSANVALASDDSATALRLIEASSPTEAAGILAVTVNAYADTAGVSLGALTVRADTGFSHGLAIVGVRTGGVSELSEMLALLGALEQAPEGLVLRDFSVTQPDPAARSESPGALRFELFVQALVRVVPSARESAP